MSIFKATPHKDHFLGFVRILLAYFPFLYNLTKNLTVQYAHNLCAVLPYFQQSLYPVIRKYYVTGQAGSGIAL